MRNLAVVVVLVGVVAGVLLYKRAPPIAATHLQDAATEEHVIERRGPTTISLVDVTTKREEGAGSFAGRVVSAANGVGVAKAELTFAINDSVATVETDANGAFVFRPTLAGTYTLMGIAAKGFATFVDDNVVHLEARPGSVINGLLFRLNAQATITVATTDGTTALADVQLAAHTPGTLTIASPRSARTGHDGTTPIAATEGDVIEASRNGYETLVHVVTGAEMKSARVALSLGRATHAVSTLTGTVVDEHDHPIDGAQVTLLGDHGALLGETVSATDGTFELADARQGLRVRATKLPYIAAMETIESDAARLTLRLRSGCMIAGRVVESSNAVPSFSVVVQRVAGRGDVPASPAVYDVDGRFEVRGATPGRYSLQVLAAGYAPSQVRVVEVPESCSVNEAVFSLGHGGSVYGRITDAATGEPLSAQISLEGFLGDDSSLAVKSTARTDADGRYEIGGLPAGRRSIVATADGHHGRIIGGLDVKEGDRSGPVDVALDAAQEGEPIRTQLTGIGAVLRPGDGMVEVINTIPGGGAAAAGLKRGDQIVQVDSIPVASVGFEDATQAIRGPENTTVTLSVKKNGEGTPIDITVTRKVLR